jgi:hypothetical protein
MKTRRQLIQFLPAVGALGLLSACGEKPSPPVVAAPASPPPPPAAAPTTPVVAAAPAPAAGGSLPLVDEKEPQAVALSYVNDPTKIDKAKFPKYEAGQLCSNCSLYQGAAADQGPCPLFPGKHVASKAWCSAWVKKTA